jgi:hypothetical protein
MADVGPDNEHVGVKLLRRHGAPREEAIVALRRLRRDGADFDALVIIVKEKTGIELKQVRKLGATDEAEAIDALMSLRENIDFNDLANVIVLEKKTIDQEKYERDVLEAYAQGQADERAQTERIIKQVQTTLPAVDLVKWLRAAQKLLDGYQQGRWHLSESEPFNELRFIKEIVTDIKWGRPNPLSPRQQNWLRKLYKERGMNPDDV